MLMQKTGYGNMSQASGNASNRLPSVVVSRQQSSSCAVAINSPSSPIPVCTQRQRTTVSATTFSRRCSLLATTVLLQQLQPWGSHHQAIAAQDEQGWLKAIAEPGRSCLAVADIQSDYDRYAPGYDNLDGGAASEALGFPELRQQLISQASGTVLEVAVGTGLNLPLYHWPAVTSLTGIDLSQGMLDEAAGRIINSIPAAYIPRGASAPTSAAEAAETFRSSRNQPQNPTRHGVAANGGIPVQLMRANVCSLPFPDNSYDVVMDTFSLCVFDRPAAALSEMVRVLKPGGRLLLLEHSKSDNPLLGAYQGATRSLVASLSKGCDWGQDVPGLVSQQPEVAISKQQRHLAGTLVSITAVKTA